MWSYMAGRGSTQMLYIIGGAEGRIDQDWMKLIK